MTNNRISVNLKINRNSHPEHGKNSWRSTTSTVVKVYFSRRSPRSTRHISYISTQLELDLLGFKCLKHPPYSPDLAPMDFAVFPYIKSFLRGQRFNDLPELRQEVMNIILKGHIQGLSVKFVDYLNKIWLTYPK
jgi:hypothetical protein